MKNIICAIAVGLFIYVACAERCSDDNDCKKGEVCIKTAVYDDKGSCRGRMIDISAQQDKKISSAQPRSQNASNSWYCDSYLGSQTFQCGDSVPECQLGSGTLGCICVHDEETGMYSCHNNPTCGGPTCTSNANCGFCGGTCLVHSCCPQGGVCMCAYCLNELPGVQQKLEKHTE